eukprot:SAG31_NODE_7886_length_1573_cov_1.398915_3_plen_153_part_00
MLLRAAIGRGASTGYFQLVYLYTSELFPSDVRSTAMGMGSAAARIGLMTTPYVAQVLDNFNLYVAMAVYAFVCFAAAAVVRSMPLETYGRRMLNSMEELALLLASCSESFSNTTREALHSDDIGGDGRPTLKDEPNAHWLVRSLRWRAKVAS